MANFAYADLDITTTTLEDAVNDSKFAQIQALTFTVKVSAASKTTLFPDINSNEDP